MKENMNELARLLKTTKSTTKIDAHYHRYKGNLDDEILMKAYATKLGFTFSAAWALFMPLEKSLAYVENDSSLATLTAEDHAILDKLALPVREAIAAVTVLESLVTKHSPLHLRCSGEWAILFGWSE